jgi:hypothetical protein
MWTVNGYCVSCTVLTKTYMIMHSYYTLPSVYRMESTVEHVRTCWNMLEHVGTCRSMSEHVVSDTNRGLAPGMYWKQQDTCIEVFLCTRNTSMHEANYLGSCQNKFEDVETKGIQRIPFACMGNCWKILEQARSRWKTVRFCGN